MFQKKEKPNFFDLLTAQAKCTVEGVELLCQYCKAPDEALGDRVKEAEKRGDHTRSNLVAEINRSFITPIDREDIFRLSGTIDDVMDYAWYTVKELRIYHIGPDQAIVEMADLLLEMAQFLYQSVHCLEKQAAQCAENAIQDIRMILKYREVYAHFNHASDKGDHAADILMDILVKR